MTPTQIQTLETLLALAAKPSPNAVDAHVFSMLYSDWLSAIKRSEKRHLADLKVILPLLYYASNLELNGEKAFKTFRASVSDFTTGWAEAISGDFGTKNFIIGQKFYLASFRAASESTLGIFEPGLMKLGASARDHLYTTFQHQPLIIMLKLDVTPNNARDILDDTFSYIELLLDKMSNGQRDSRWQDRISKSKINPEFVDRAIRGRQIQTYSKSIPAIFAAIRALLEKREHLDAHDPDLRLLCEQRIDHAIVTRRFSFKARPKHFNYTDAAASLRDCRAVFDQGDVDFFLMSGTLLGAVREKGFIASDYDIDLGIFDNQADIPRITEIIDESDLFTIHEIVEDSIVKIKHVNGIVIDLFIYFEVDGLQCHRGGVHEWYNGPFGLTEIDFLGGKYYIPDNHEEWLAENYGNWEKPVVFYDMSYDTPNRDYVTTNTKGIYYLWDRLEKAIRKGWNNYMSMASHAMKSEFNIDVTRHLPPSLRRNDKPVFNIFDLSKDSVDTVIVDTFEDFTASLTNTVASLPAGKAKAIAVVLSNAYRNAASDVSDAERLELASMLAGIVAVHLVDTEQELRQVRSAFEAAEFWHLYSEKQPHKELLVSDLK